MSNLSKGAVDPAESGLSTKHFQAIKTVLYDSAGIRLADHKRLMVENRIAKRLRDLSLTSYADYIDYLQSSGKEDELVHLVNVLTTNVTHFFREGHHFEHMSATLEGWVKQGAGRIRVWSAGCSLGAEPYSAALTILKVKEKTKRNINARILATDIDTLTLARARKAEFKEGNLKGLSKVQLDHAFQKAEKEGAAMYKLKDTIRSMVAFNYLNLNTQKWPMSGPFDFIFCRNVLIYFDRTKQNEIVSRLLSYLRPGGFFYLGHSEHAVMEGRGLKSCGKTIYQKMT